MNAIGTQLRDLINSGLTRWRMAVINELMDVVTEIGRNPVSKQHVQPEYRDVILTRDGNAQPVSRDQLRRRERGQGNVHVHFPCSADHEQVWQPYPIDPSLAIYVMTIHTYPHRV